MSGFQPEGDGFESRTPFHEGDDMNEVLKIEDIEFEKDIDGDLEIIFEYDTEDIYRYLGPTSVQQLKEFLNKHF